MNEYTDEQVEEAIKFVIKDNPEKEWQDEDELFDAVNNHLLEETVISNIEELIKIGFIKEIAPDSFVPTEKGLKYLEEVEKNKNANKKV